MRPSTTPQAIIIGHAPDGDIERLVPALREAGITVLVWRLDAPDRDVEVQAEAGRFLLCRQGHCLSSTDMEQTCMVIHRVGIGRLNRPVIATRGTDASRRFVEREWSTLLVSLLLDAEQRYPHIVWVNRPSVSMVASKKHHLLSTADLDGFTVAHFSVSTQNVVPNSQSDQWICKAIDEDQEVDEQRTFSSARLPEELLNASPFRTDCPSLIQERVVADHELRVYYLLGRVLALKLVTDQEYVDIRLLPRHSFSVVPVHIEADLSGMVRSYCNRRGLSYCVFDFLASTRSGYTLIDVTPGGSWSHYEDVAELTVTRWYASVVADVIRHSRARSGAKDLLAASRE